MQLSEQISEYKKEALPSEDDVRGAAQGLVMLWNQYRYTFIDENNSEIIMFESFKNFNISLIICINCLIKYKDLT